MPSLSLMITNKKKSFLKTKVMFLELELFRIKIERKFEIGNAYNNNNNKT